MEVDSVTLAEIRAWGPLLPNFLWVLGLGGSFQQFLGMFSLQESQCQGPKDFGDCCNFTAGQLPLVSED